MLDLEAVFVGANRRPHCAAVLSLGRVVFGAGSLLAVWQPGTAAGIQRTYAAHRSTVAAVCVAGGLVVSGDDSGRVVVWESGHELVPVREFQDGSHAVVCIAGNSAVFVVGSASGTVRVYGTASGELVGEYTAPGFYPLSAAVQDVGGGHMVAVGGTTSTVLVFSVASGFRLEASLAGHEDWVKAVAFHASPDGWMLASGSQDRYIRLWRVARGAAAADPTRLVLLSNTPHSATVGGQQLTITFDSLIMGHDDWISGLQWHPHEPRLLLLGADTLLMVWSMDAALGVWVCEARLGDMSIKGASTATGASGGFWAALWHVGECEWVALNGRSGSWRSWSREAERWAPHEFPATGSAAPVTDVCWFNGAVLSTLTDQTTRLVALHHGLGTWHEYARPQIHGYDMVCVAPVDASLFVSAGDEKLLRAFAVPQPVAEMLDRQTPDAWSGSDDTASVPVLGLSNKGGSSGAELPLTTPPLEDLLQRYTLFPETDKMYGHGHEVALVAVLHSGAVVALSCRANAELHAAVRTFVWDETHWQPRDVLVGHQLTATRVRFLPDDAYLLSVLRDRLWCLWRREGSGYVLWKSQAKAHLRIVWDCAWGLEGFFTTGRDRCVRYWRLGAEEVELAGEVKMETVGHAVDVYEADGRCNVAVGMADGEVVVYTVGREGGFVESARVGAADRPSGQVTRVAWNHGRLAVGSVDGSVRVYGRAGV